MHVRLYDAYCMATKSFRLQLKNLISCLILVQIFSGEFVLSWLNCLKVDYRTVITTRTYNQELYNSKKNYLKLTLIAYSAVFDKTVSQKIMLIVWYCFGPNNDTKCKQVLLNFFHVLLLTGIVLSCWRWAHLFNLH